jgi:hypothetical protein
MEEDLEYEGEHELIPDLEEREEVHDAFHSLIIYLASIGNILDDGMFDSNGSVLLIRGEY